MLLLFLLLEMLAPIVIGSGGQSQCLYSAEEHCMKDTEVMGKSFISHQTLKPSDCGELYDKLKLKFDFMIFSNVVPTKHFLPVLDIDWHSLFPENNPDKEELLGRSCIRNQELCLDNRVSGCRRKFQ